MDINDKFQRINQDYKEYYKESFLRKGMLPMKNTELGIWGYSLGEEVFELFNKIGLDKKKNFLDLGCPRIGGRFRKKDAGVFAHGGRNGTIVAHFNNGAVDVELAQARLAEVQGAFVGIVGDDDVVARVEQGEQRRGDGAHAGGKQHGVLGPFERRKLALGGVLGRVAITPVFKAVLRAQGEFLDLAGILEDERRGLNDGGGDRAVFVVTDFTRVDRRGRETGASFVVHTWALF